VTLNFVLRLIGPARESEKRTSRMGFQTPAQYMPDLSIPIDRNKRKPRTGKRRMVTSDEKSSLTQEKKGLGRVGFELE